MPYLKTKWFGVFLYDDKIIDYTLFPKNPEEIANRLHKMMAGELLDEELPYKTHAPIVNCHRQKAIGLYGLYNDINIVPQNFGYSLSLLQQSCILLTNKKIEEEQKDRTKRISEAIYTLDDTIKIINILYERIRTWNDYFTLDTNIDDEELIKDESLKIIGKQHLDELEENSLKNIACCLKKCINMKNKLELYINSAMKEISPNISDIVGTNIAARLVAKAGGLKELALLPSSTIQVLGAEQALFRHLKDGTPSPKHGILFQHEMINTSSKKHRGKIARLLATKIATGAKADAFTKNLISADLIRDIEIRYSEITGKVLKYYTSVKP